VLYTGLRLPVRDEAAIEARRRLTTTVREAAPRTVSQPPAVEGVRRRGSSGS
jgi:hypothetical protein